MINSKGSFISIIPQTGELAKKSDRIRLMSGCLLNVYYIRKAGKALFKGRCVCVCVCARARVCDLFSVTFNARPGVRGTLPPNGNRGNEREQNSQFIYRYFRVCIHLIFKHAVLGTHLSYLGCLEQ